MTNINNAYEKRIKKIFKTSPHLKTEEICENIVRVAFNHERQSLFYKFDIPSLEWFRKHLTLYINFSKNDHIVKSEKCKDV